MLSAIGLFASLDPAARSSIEAGMIIRKFPKSVIVILQEDRAHSSMYLVLEGRLRVYRTHHDGRELTLSVLTQGDYFGELALLDPAPRSASVITVEPCCLAMLSREHLFKCIDQQPLLAKNLLSSLAAQFRSRSIWMSDLALLDVYGRVAKFLLEHAHEHDQIRMTDSVTQQEIAQHIGASREMVSRIFKELRAGGYITLDGKKIILNRELPARW